MIGFLITSAFENYTVIQDSIRYGFNPDGYYWYPETLNEPKVIIEAQNCMVHLLHT